MGTWMCNLSGTPLKFRFIRSNFFFFFLTIGRLFYWFPIPLDTLVILQNVSGESILQDKSSVTNVYVSVAGIPNVQQLSISTCAKVYSFPIWFLYFFCFMILASYSALFFSLRNINKIPHAPSPCLPADGAAPEQQTESIWDRWYDLCIRIFFDFIFFSLLLYRPCITRYI